MNDFIDAFIEILGQLLRPETSIFELLTSWAFRNSFYSFVFTFGFLLFVGGSIYLMVTENPFDWTNSIVEFLEVDFTCIRPIILSIVAIFILIFMALNSASGAELGELLARNLFQFLIFFKIGGIYGAFKVGKWGGLNTRLFTTAFGIAFALSLLSFFIGFVVPFVAILSVSATTYAIFRYLRDWGRMNIGLLLGTTILIGLSSTVDYEIESIINQTQDFLTLTMYGFLSISYILAFLGGGVVGVLTNRNLYQRNTQ